VVWADLQFHDHITQLMWPNQGHTHGPGPACLEVYDGQLTVGFVTGEVYNGQLTVGFVTEEVYDGQLTVGFVTGEEGRYI